MPVVSPNTLDGVKRDILEVARKFLSGIEIDGTKDNTVTFTTGMGSFHQDTIQFKATIIVGETPKDAQITLVRVAIDETKLMNIAQTFCREKYDCRIEIVN